MWPKPMRFIVASVAQIVTEDNENWRNFKTVVFQDMYTNELSIFIYILYVQKLFMWNYEAPEFRGPGSGEPPEP